MTEKISYPEHKTIEAQTQEVANKMNSELTIQKQTDNLSHPQIEPEMERICDLVNQRLAKKKSSKQKPDLAQQKRDLARQCAEVKAKFVENQAMFAESRAKFLSSISKYSKST